MPKVNVGDIITAYHAGYHRVLTVGVEGKGASYHLVTYERVLDKNGKKAGGKPQRCDSSYCVKVTPSLANDIIAKEMSVVHTLSANLKELLGIV